MRDNRYAVGHQKSHKSSIQTQDHTYVDFKEANYEAKEDQRDVISKEAPSLAFLGRKTLQKFLSSEETKNGHNRQVLQKDAQLNYFPKHEENLLNLARFLVFSKAVKNSLVFVWTLVDILDIASACETSYETDIHID